MYFLRKKGKIVYVGQTNDIYRRISEHVNDKQYVKDFDSWDYIPCEDKDKRTEYERLFIQALQPPLNIDSKTSYDPRSTTIPSESIERRHSGTDQQHEALIKAAELIRAFGKGGFFLI